MVFQTLRDRQDYETFFTDMVYAYVPTRTECSACGVDTFTGGAKDINCATCNGTGYTTVWRKSGLRCRVTWMDPAAIRVYGGVVSTGELGDVLIAGRYDDKRVYDKVADMSNIGYLLVDTDKRVKPTSVTRNRLGGYTSLEVRANLVRQRDD